MRYGFGVKERINTNTTETYVIHKVNERGQLDPTVDYVIGDVGVEEHGEDHAGLVPNALISKVRTGGKGQCKRNEVKS